MSIVKQLLAEIKQLKGPDLKAFQKGLGGVLDLSSLSRIGGGSGGLGFTDVFTGGISPIDDMNTRFRTQLELLQNIGVSSRETAAQIGVLEEKSIELFGRIDEGNQVLRSLAEGMDSLAFFSGKAAAELSNNAMVLEALGVSAGQTAEVFDEAVFSFGSSERELKSLTEELGTIVSQFPGQAQKIAANFSIAQKSLAYDSGKIMDVFKRLQATSSRTGVEFSVLTDTFGTQMDTFEQSAQKAGSLNALLGRSVFNSIDLLGKTEAERVDTIISGIRKNVNVESLKRNRFQLKSVAASLGLNVSQTRRLLSGQTTVQDALKEKESSDPRVRATMMLNEAMNTSTKSLEELTVEFKSFRGPFQNMIIRQQKIIRDGMLNMMKDAVDGVGDTDLNNMNDLIQASILSIATGANQNLAGAVGELLQNFNIGNLKNLLEIQKLTGGMTIKELQELNVRSAQKAGLLSEEMVVDEIASVFTKTAERLLGLATGEDSETGPTVPGGPKLSQPAQGVFGGLISAVSGLTEAFTKGLTITGTLDPNTHQLRGKLTKAQAGGGS